ncbi:hypothetical protein GJAV_G00232960 [Gymnothorax javanicus]|nr:hypothetical protein GJAV_G00232960 [Gymnothorax javanicus]
MLKRLAIQSARPEGGDLDSAYVPFVLGDRDFRAHSRKFQWERPLKSDFQLRKSEILHLPRLSSSRWLHRTSTRQHVDINNKRICCMGHA